jgi:hypothetical protein
MADGDPNDIRRERATLIVEIAVAMPVTVALWFAIDRGLPPIAGMDDPLARLDFAIKCCCVAILFSFVTAIEAVAHERLRSPALDPLKGYETQRMKINLRYLQHTLEQLMVFVPGLLGLAVYCPDGSTMRAVAATTVVWVLARIAFWIGYHFGARHRAIGAPGKILGIGMLIYVAWRFGYDVAGYPGAFAPIAVFAAAEAFLTYATRPRKA